MRTTAAGGPHHCHPFAAALLDAGKPIRLRLHGAVNTQPRTGRLVPSHYMRRVLVEGLTLDELAKVPGIRCGVFH